ncbi:MAG: hypothetical protein NTX65_11700 [Ignavibacteriales bacterium]|nr:hypothetical protein [Ignavibacteriales bacterium]
MRIERFSFTALEKQLEGIELDVEKIEFISNEIVRCRNAIQDVKCEVKNIEPADIKISAKTTKQETTLVELINSDKKIKQAVTMDAVQLCGDKLCEEYFDYLERTEALLAHHRTKLEAKAKWMECSRSENNVTNKVDISERIVWRSGKENLLKLFDCLYRNEIIPKYSKEEILIHFTDEKQEPLCRGFHHSKKFSWNDSDCSFAIFVDELAKRGAIDDENKFKVIAKHFVNKKGTVFRDLPQKKNYTENFTQTGNLIRRILGEINFSVVIYFYALLSSFMSEA